MASADETSTRSLRAANLLASTGKRQFKTADLRKLDSALKKTTAFMKKLRMLCDDQKESLLAEMVKLNLSHYATEAAVTMADVCTKFKNAADVPATIEIASEFHQRYPDFSAELEGSLNRLFSSLVSKPSDKEEERAARSKERRQVLRLHLESVLAGIITNVSSLQSAIKELVTAEMNKLDFFTSTMPLMIMVARVASYEIGLDERKEDGKKVNDVNPVFNEKQRGALQAMFDTYFESAVSALTKVHGAMKDREKKNKAILQTKGVLTDEQENSYNVRRKVFDKLLDSVNTLSELLTLASPKLTAEEEEEENETLDTIQILASGALYNPDAEEGPYGDEMTRQFYTSLPNPKAALPAILFKGAIDPVSRAEPREDDEEEEKKTPQSRDDEDDDGAVSSGTSNAQAFESLLSKMSTFSNKDQVDQFVTEFFYVNTSKRRKRLLEAIFLVPRDRTELLPFYARLAAIIEQYYPDDVFLLVDSLFREFHGLCRRKDSTKIESRIKNAKLIGELVKFGVMSVKQVFSLIRMCMDDFTARNIETMNALLEICGRYLFLTPSTHVRMRNVVEALKRLKEARHLDGHMDLLVQNCIILCEPSVAVVVKRKDRTPSHAYIRHLLFATLNPNTWSTIVKQLRKIDWESDGSYVLKCLRKPEKIRYSAVRYMASVAAGLGKYYPNLTVSLVDDVIIDIVESMQRDDYREQQKRVAQVKYFGELYNYNIADSMSLMHLLYLFVYSGHEGSWIGDTDVPCANDMPRDTIRIRLICTLLETCGMYFNHGIWRKRMDRFLLYFQRYLFSKSFLTTDVEFMIMDVFEQMRPKMKLTTSWNELQTAIGEAESADLSMQMDAEMNNAPMPPTDLVLFGPQSLVVPRPGEEEQVLGEVESDDDKLESDDDKSFSSFDEEEEEEEEEDEEEYEEEEDEMVLDVNRDTVSREEVDIFDRELATLISDDIEQRRFQPRRVGGLDVSIPMGIFSEKKRDGERVFHMLSRKGGKQIAREIAVPSTSALATQNIQATEDALAEQAALKRHVLEASFRQKKEEFEEELPEGAPVPDGSGPKPLGGVRVAFQNTRRQRRGRGRGGAATRQLNDSHLAQFGANSTQSGAQPASGRGR